MGYAARAIIIENGKILLMHRNKYGSEYYTLVGGRVNEGENMEQTLIREIYEETGLKVVAATLMFVENHPEPYTKQHIYLCNVAPHDDKMALRPDSEEANLNQYQMNLHAPFWVSLQSFKHLTFRTPQLQQAILDALKKGFPKQPINL